MSLKVESGNGDYCDLFFSRHLEVQKIKGEEVKSLGGGAELGGPKDLGIKSPEEAETYAHYLQEILAPYLKNLSAIFSSPYQKALQTIDIFAKQFRLSINVSAFLNEKNHGDLLKADDNWKKERSYVDYSKLSPLESLFALEAPGAETRHQVMIRVIGLIQDVAQKNLGKMVVLSSHDGAMRSILEYVHIVHQIINNQKETHPWSLDTLKAWTQEKLEQAHVVLKDKVMHFKNGQILHVHAWKDGRIEILDTVKTTFADYKAAAEKKVH